jgi:predicted TPR repeat methyltransferase
MDAERTKKWDDYYASGQDFDTLSDEELDEIIAIASNPKTALDLGCGTGELMEKLERRDLVTTGVEFSVEAIEQAGQRGVSGNIIRCDLDDIPEDFLSESEYDVIFLKLVIAFLKNRDSLFRFVSRRLSKGGSFVVITPIWNDEKLTTREYIAVDERVLLEDLRRHFSDISLIKEIRRKFGYVHIYVIKSPVSSDTGVGRAENR